MDQNTQSKKQNWLNRHPVWTGLIIVLMLFWIIGVVSSIDTDKQPISQPSSSSQSSSNKQTIGLLGETGILNNNEVISDCSGIVLVASTKEAFDELTMISASSDNYGLQGLIAQDKVFTLSNCTKVKVIDSGLTKTKVRVIEQGKEHITGWVAYEFVVGE